MFEIDVVSAAVVAAMVPTFAAVSSAAAAAVPDCIEAVSASVLSSPADALRDAMAWEAAPRTSSTVLLNASIACSSLVLRSLDLFTRAV